MTRKQFTVLFIAAAVLGVAAYMRSSGSKPAGALLNGKAVFPKLEISEVARVELGDKLKLAAGDGGWVVETFHNYPADHTKLADNLLKLTELKVGQVARGKTLDSPDELVLKDAAGKTLASLPLGERHAKWGHGRYATFAGETVLVSDALDAFAEGGKAWVETKIVDTPWISFTDIAEGVPEEELGFATGVVAKVTIAGDTNRVATIGAAVKGGSERYLRLDGSDWVYVVSGYSVDSLLPKPPPPEPETPADAAATDAPEKAAAATATDAPKKAADATATDASESPETPAADTPQADS